MDMFSQKIYKKFFRMWNCEYGYVFAKNLQEVFSNVELRIWICFRKNLQEVFRIWNCESSRCSNAELARHTQFGIRVDMCSNMELAFSICFVCGTSKCARCFRI